MESKREQKTARQRVSSKVYRKAKRMGYVRVRLFFIKELPVSSANQRHSVSRNFFIVEFRLLTRGRHRRGCSRLCRWLLSRIRSAIEFINLILTRIFKVRIIIVLAPSGYRHSEKKKMNNKSFLFNKIKTTRETHREVGSPSATVVLAWTRRPRIVRMLSTLIFYI